MEHTGSSREQLAGYEQMMKGYFDQQSPEGLQHWAREQVFLAIGNVLSFLAQKEIDSCPVGGFQGEKVDAVLGLKELGYQSVLLMPIGYRSTEDHSQKRAKVRFEKQDIVSFL